MRFRLAKLPDPNISASTCPFGMMPEVEKLETYTLNAEDYDRLLAQSALAASFLRHDGFQPLSIVSINAGQILALRRQDAGTDHALRARLAEIARHAKDSIRQVESFHKYLSRMQPSRGAGMSVRPFVAEVAEAVAADSHDGTIAIDS